MIEIPITVQVKLRASGIWDILDCIDARTNGSLGRLTAYGINDGPDFLEQISVGVLEAILQKEKLESESTYSIHINIFENGRQLSSIRKQFPGNEPPEIPKNWRVVHKKHVFKYLPYEGYDQKLTETGDQYAKRIRAEVLPKFPEEVLKEWFYWHPRVIEDYSFLNFEKMKFERQVWKVEDLPGREAFREDTDFDYLSSIFEQRLRDKNWLAKNMNRHRTWPTPILLLDNRSGDLRFPVGDKLKKPYHLLEGHTRRSFLSVLHAKGRALKEHEVFIVSLDN
jgi:hypothetical protein